MGEGGGGAPSATNPSGPAVFSSSAVMPPQGEDGEPQSSLFEYSAQSSAVRLVKDCPRSLYDSCMRTPSWSSSSESDPRFAIFIAGRVRPPPDGKTTGGGNGGRILGVDAGVAVESTLDFRICPISFQS